MKILYLHGYNSTNINPRTEWLSQFGKVYHPLMKYKNIPKDYKWLDKLVNKHRFDVIVASSMGGFMAFHLGNYYNIPTVLLNPALIMTMVVRPDIRQLATQTKHFIGLGIYDDVIPPYTTRKILNDYNSNFAIKEFDTGHKISLEIFTEICNNSGLFEN